MDSRVDSSWRSLYKSGGIGFLLSGIFAILFIVAQAIIYTQMVAYNPKNIGDLLTFALTRTNLYYVEYYSAGLWMLFALPGVMALYFVLSHRDKGFALIGSALGLLGIGIFLSNLADHILFVQEAVTYSGGCTSCAAQALSAAAATSSAGIAAYPRWVYARSWHHLLQLTDVRWARFREAHRWSRSGSRGHDNRNLPSNRSDDGKRCDILRRCAVHCSRGSMVLHRRRQIVQTRITN